MLDWIGKKMMSIPLLRRWAITLALKYVKRKYLSDVDSEILADIISDHFERLEIIANIFTDNNPKNAKQLIEAFREQREDIICDLIGTAILAVKHEENNHPITKRLQDIQKERCD